MAPVPSKTIHVHILYTTTYTSASTHPSNSSTTSSTSIPPSSSSSLSPKNSITTITTGTTFARSARPVAVKSLRQLKGQEKWGKCELGEVIRAVCASNPDLLPTSQHDHNIFIYNPKLTSSEHKRTGATSIQPIEDQLGLIAWALDRNGDKTKEMVMGFWRQDEVEEKEEGAVDEEDEEDEEIEEWLEVRLRLVKTKAVSYEQHLATVRSYESGMVPSSTTPSIIATPDTVVDTTALPNPVPSPPKHTIPLVSNLLTSSSGPKDSAPDDQASSSTRSVSRPLRSAASSASSSTPHLSHHQPQPSESSQPVPLATTSTTTSPPSSASSSHPAPTYTAHDLRSPDPAPSTSSSSLSSSGIHPSSSRTVPLGAYHTYPFAPSSDPSPGATRRLKPGVESQLFHALPPSEMKRRGGSRKKVPSATTGAASTAIVAGSMAKAGKGGTAVTAGDKTPKSAGQVSTPITTASSAGGPSSKTKGTGTGTKKKKKKDLPDAGDDVSTTPLAPIPTARPSVHLADAEAEAVPSTPCTSKGSSRRVKIRSNPSSRVPAPSTTVANPPISSTSSTSESKPLRSAAPLELTPELLHLLTTLHKTEDLPKDLETARLVRALLDAAEHSTAATSYASSTASTSSLSATSSAAVVAGGVKTRSSLPDLMRTESAPAHLQSNLLHDYPTATIRTDSAAPSSHIHPDGASSLLAQPYDPPRLRSTTRAGGLHLPRRATTTNVVSTTQPQPHQPHDRSLAFVTNELDPSVASSSSSSTPSVASSRARPAPSRRTTAAQKGKLRAASSPPLMTRRLRGSSILFEESETPQPLEEEDDDDDDDDDEDEDDEDDEGLSSSTTRVSRKRKYAPDLVGENGELEGCANCGRKRSIAWRKKKDGGKVCNACGIYWNKFKTKRPASLWGDTESSPRRRKRRPFGRATTATSPGGSITLRSPLTKTLRRRPSATAMTSPIRGKESWDGLVGSGGGFGGSFGAKLVGVVSRGEGDSDEDEDEGRSKDGEGEREGGGEKQPIKLEEDGENGQDENLVTTQMPPRSNRETSTSSTNSQAHSHPHRKYSSTTPDQLPSPFRVGSGYNHRSADKSTTTPAATTTGSRSHDSHRAGSHHHTDDGVSSHTSSNKSSEVRGGGGGGGKHASPRTALKMHLREGREVKLRRLNGPLSDDEGDLPAAERGTAETQGGGGSSGHPMTRGVNNHFGQLTSMGGGPSDGGLEPFHPTTTTMAGADPVGGEPWMSTEEFSALFDNLRERPESTDPPTSHLDLDDLTDPFDAHSIVSSQGRNLSDLLDDAFPQSRPHHYSTHPPPSSSLLPHQRSPSSISQHSSTSTSSSHPFTSSSYYSSSQYSSPLSMPYDFSHLPPSSPPVIPAGLFSSPESFSGVSRTTTGGGGGPGSDLDGLVEGLDFPSPIFSILSATPTGEGPPPPHHHQHHLHHITSSSATTTTNTTISTPAYIDTDTTTATTIVLDANLSDLTTASTDGHTHSNTNNNNNHNSSSSSSDSSTTGSDSLALMEKFLTSPSGTTSQQTLEAFRSLFAYSPSRHPLAKSHCPPLINGLNGGGGDVSDGGRGGGGGGGVYDGPPTTSTGMSTHGPQSKGSLSLMKDQRRDEVVEAEEEEGEDQDADRTITESSRGLSHVEDDAGLWE